MTQDLTQLSAGALQALVAARKVSAREVAAAFLARIERLNPTVNAICTPNPRLLAEAEECDRRLAAGDAARPIEGVPFVVKDILPTKGLRTTFGSEIHRDLVPDEDALVVERLRAAGGVMVGKTNVPEFAHDVNTTNRIFGLTRNPIDLNVTAGGSSGGTGAAVVADMAPLGIGTDLGGSVRIPSAYCGLSGLRPAPGRIPYHPTEFAWDTLVQHVIGPMTRSVADNGLMLSVMAGPDDRDPTSLPGPDHDYVRAASGSASIAGRRIAYSRDLGGLMPVDPAVEALTRQAARDFEGLGCIVEEAEFDISGLKEAMAGTRGFAMVARYADRLDAHREKMTPQLIGQVTDALKLDVRAIARAERLRTEYWHRVRRFLERYDHILTPTIGAPPFRIDRPLPTEIGGRPVARYYDVFNGLYAFSVTGLPAMSVPCGWTADGLPVGLQIVGHRLREDRVLEAAAAYAEACPAHFARRPLSAVAAAPQTVLTPGMRFT